MSTSTVVLLQLFLAHILTDFVFQSNAWIKHKKAYKTKSYLLYVHAFIAGALTYIFLQDWTGWEVPLGIAVTHFFIDAWKLHSGKDTLRYFLWDQFFHVFVLLVAWLYLSIGFSSFAQTLWEMVNSPKILAVVFGYLLVIYPAGLMIGKATARWQDEIPATITKEGSLASAGKYIGIFERVLVLTTMLMGNFSAIGFLIAAKSILRYNEKSDTGARKQTEYVLIGTLMSFTSAILVGLLVRFFL